MIALFWQATYFFLKFVNNPEKKIDSLLSLFKNLQKIISLYVCSFSKIPFKCVNVDKEPSTTA